ncbi:MAG: hypothetical protein DMF04_07925 [Verrucomicrobia bacterium]|nr:MAG: hypothetical protein DMF04_07925 [Verrucomicrobiota bacterium]
MALSLRLCNAVFRATGFGSSMMSYAAILCATSPPAAESAFPSAREEERVSRAWMGRFVLFCIKGENQTEAFSHYPDCKET